MAENIRLFRKSAVREAFEAGAKSALADPVNLRTIFEAGERKGAAWLNESINAKSFMEIMDERRRDSPGDFNSWMRMNESRMCIPIKNKRFNDIDGMDVFLMKGIKNTTLDAIENAVSAVFGISPEVLRNNQTRLMEIKTPRHYCYYLAYFHCPDKLSSIGKRWGNRDHATVMHGAARVSSDALNYDTYRNVLMDVYLHLLVNGYKIDPLKFVGDGLGRRGKPIEFIKINI